MKQTNYISENLKDVLTETDAYLTDNKIDVVYYRNPFHEIQDLDQFPILSAFLNKLGLTLKSLNVYTIWYTPVASSLPVPYLVIPYKGYSDMSLNIHELKENAIVNRLENIKYPFYMLSQTKTIDVIDFKEDTIYFINGDVVHSFQYEDLSPMHHAEFGTFLLIGVNEDISSYFTE